jgi:hypothetical protein
MVESISQGTEFALLTLCELSLKYTTDVLLRRRSSHGEHARPEWHPTLLSDTFYENHNLI